MIHWQAFNVYHVRLLLIQTDFLFDVCVCVREIRVITDCNLICVRMGVCVFECLRKMIMCVESSININMSVSFINMCVAICFMFCLSKTFHCKYQHWHSTNKHAHHSHTHTQNPSPRTICRKPHIIWLVECDTWPEFKRVKGKITEDLNQQNMKLNIQPSSSSYDARSKQSKSKYAILWNGMTKNSLIFRENNWSKTLTFLSVFRFSI